MENCASGDHIDGIQKTALITGITGQVSQKNVTFFFLSEDANRFMELLQDGSYLAELLITKGYAVHGIIRRSSSFNTARIQHLYADPKSHKQGKMKLHYGEMTDSSCLVKLINEIKPDEIYNLAAQSHVKVCYDSPLNFLVLILNFFRCHLI